MASVKIIWELLPGSLSTIRSWFFGSASVATEYMRSRHTRLSLDSRYSLERIALIGLLLSQYTSDRISSPTRCRDSSISDHDHIHYLRYIYV